MKKVKKMTEEDGVSMRVAAVSLQISPSQITHWTKNVDKLTGHASKVEKSLNTGWQSDIC
jgi:DNA-binding transcriptional regulator YiaG